MFVMLLLFKGLHCAIDYNASAFTDLRTSFHSAIALLLGNSYLLRRFLEC